MCTKAAKLKLDHDKRYRWVGLLNQNIGLKCVEAPAARLLYDFAIVVVTPDDTTTMRGMSAPAPRDNLLFELGLFAGALGRARTFLVLPADSPPRLPTDLSGVTTTSFRARTDGNLVAALGPAMSKIMRAMGIDRGGAG
jgi:predicted nucleotide-binding protein